MCMAGDCEGAVIVPECTGITGMFVGVPVQVKLEGSSPRQCRYKLLASDPPKEATVWVRFSGTEHHCVDWSVSSVTRPTQP
jgi:hypothetical protein